MYQSVMYVRGCYFAYKTCFFLDVLVAVDVIEVPILKIHCYFLLQCNELNLGQPTATVNHCRATLIIKESELVSWLAN